jgi:enamine deaminase RidA (YjgF/YER057c/UK114 family)
MGIAVSLFGRHHRHAGCSRWDRWYLYGRTTTPCWRFTSCRANWCRQGPISFSRAVRVGQFIAVAGTAPIGTTGGTAAPGDVYGRTIRCLEIIAHAISEAGGTMQQVSGTMQQVIRTRIMLTDILKMVGCCARPWRVFSRGPPVTGLRALGNGRTCSVTTVATLRPVCHYAKHGGSSQNSGCAKRASWWRDSCASVSQPQRRTGRAHDRGCARADHRGGTPGRCPLSFSIAACATQQLAAIGNLPTSFWTGPASCLERCDGSSSSVRRM